MTADQSVDLSAAMAKLTDGVTRVRVFAGGVANGQALGELVCEVEGEAAAAAVGMWLAVEQPTRQFHCMCLGAPAIELWVGTRRRATIGVHHGRSVRVEGWWSDAPLCDGEGLLRWLDGLGVREPLAGLLADRAQRSEDERRRAAWLAATPAVLRARLPALEGTGEMLPRSAQASDADVVAAVAEVRAALGDAGAAAALLAWFGGAGGPWSGYPAYEAVAEALLAGMPFAPLIAAGDGDDDGVLLGLARFLARHGAPPRERQAVGEGLRERLVAAVRARGTPDMLGRCARLLNVSPMAIDAAVRIGDAEEGTTLAGPVACGRRWAALDAHHVVRFESGQRRGIVRAMLAPDERAELGVVAEELVVALTSSGEVWRVPILSGEVRVIARGQARPMAPTGLDRHAAWLEQVPLKDHETRTRVWLEGRAQPVAEHVGNAWDLLCCDSSLWWARHGGTLWSTIFGKDIHRVDLLRWDAARGRAQVVAKLEGGDDGTSVPRLFTDGVRIAWTSGRKIGVMDPRDEARRWFEVDAEIVSVCPLRNDVLVALARDGVGELVRLLAGGRREVLARWPRAAWERERLAVMGHQVVWNAGEHLWAVTLM